MALPTATISALPPEVISLIGHRLSRHDLTICVCVSQEWHTLFNPYLWHTVTWGPPSHPTTGFTNWNVTIDVGICLEVDYEWQTRIMACIGAGALKRSGHLIRVLDVWVFEVLSTLVTSDIGGETVTQLREFVVPSYEMPERISVEKRERGISGFVRRGTVHLVPHYPLRRNQERWECLCEVQKSLVTVLRRNPDLYRLKIVGELLLREGVVCEEVRDAIPRRLECLELRREWTLCEESASNTVEDSDNTPGAVATAALSSPCPSSLSPLPLLLWLKRLDISPVRLSHAAFDRILKSCPALETLCLNDLSGFTTKNLASSIRAHCTNLTDLILREWIPSSDETLAELINSSIRGWKTLGIPIGHHGKMRFGPLATEALLKHSWTLENLRMEGHQGFTSAAVHELFCSAPRLKRFAGVGRDRFYGRSVQLDARDIWSSSREWVCLNLESLKIQISEVPRPDLVSRTNGRPFRNKQPLSVETLDHSRQVQAKVYEQLGRLTQLRELVLGRDDVDVMEEVMIIEEENEGEYYYSGGEEDNGVQTGFQYHCLDMSLASGMDRMRGLRELRAVKVEAMATQFWKKEEQQWVDAHWPNIMSDRENREKEEGDRAWMNRRWEKNLYLDRFWMDYGLPEYC